MVRFGQKGLKELMFGGTTKYILENSTIPIFMSHYHQINYNSFINIVI